MEPRAGTSELRRGFKDWRWLFVLAQRKVSL
jgi:hypothetical protein